MRPCGLGTRSSQVHVILSVNSSGPSCMRDQLSPRVVLDHSMNWCFQAKIFLAPQTDDIKVKKTTSFHLNP